MKYYLTFSPTGAYLLGDKRCDVAFSADGKKYTYTAGFRAAEHTVDAADEAAAVAALELTVVVAPPRTARQVLAEAERTGIDVTLGSVTYRLKCAESDRGAFAQRAALLLTHQEFMTGAQKTAHRATQTVIVDAAGTSHVITVLQYQQLVLAYGEAYEALWAAANPVE
jgi:hypothetical protein